MIGELIYAVIETIVELFLLTCGSFIRWILTGMKGSFKEFYFKKTHQNLDSIIGLVFWITALITAYQILY